MADRKNSAEERQKRIKRLKRRLLPSALAGFTLPFILFSFGTFDIFAQNRAEFAFSLYDFLLPCVALTLGVGAVLTVIPLFLRKKVYSLYVAVLFWASVMFFVQGNYLNFGLTSLAGDGVDEGATLSVVAINAFIWIITLVATVFCVLRFKPVRKKLRSVVSLGLALILFMQAVGGIAVSFGDDVFATKRQMLEDGEYARGVKILTSDGITELSPNRNVVIFVVDRFDSKYYGEAMRKCPEIFSELEGFTYYDDHVTLYPRTFPAIPYMLTGVENDYSEARVDYLKRAYSNADNLKFLKEQGYSVNVYTDGFYAYEDASVMEEYTDNVLGYDDYTVTDKGALFGSMLALSLYRYLPFFAKSAVASIGTDTFDAFVEYTSSDEAKKYDTDNKHVYELLTEHDFSLTEDSGRFTFVHVDGCHIPNDYDGSFNELEDSDASIADVMTQSFKIISRYLSEMKRLGVYDDATVVITGDHAAAISDRKELSGERVTALFAKPSGVGKGETVINRAQTSQEDLWMTVFDSEGLSGHSETRGMSLIGIDENIQRERIYLFQRYIDKNNAEELTYRIVGDSKIFGNWEIVSRRQIRGTME